MLRRLALLLLLALSLAASGPAWAKKGLPAKLTVPAIPSVARAGLRGFEVAPTLPPALGLGAAPAFGAGLGPSATAPSAASGLAARGLNSLTRLPSLSERAQSGLIGLRSGADPAPVCRAACARERYFCLASGGDEGCDGRWGQCLGRCAGTTPR